MRNILAFLHGKKEIAILAIISVFMTEIITTSTTLLELTSPMTLIFLILGYALPVILIRELIILHRLGIVGIFLLGFLAGVYSEGIIAHTLFVDTISPVDIFASYGVISNIRIPWLLTIGSWQSLHAVVYPIFFMAYLFPHSHTKLYMSDRGRKILSISLFIISLIFLLIQGKNLMSESILYLVLIGILVLCTRRYGHIGKIDPKKEDMKSSRFWKFGVGLYMAFSLIPLLFAKFEVSLWIYILYFFIICLMIKKKLSESILDRVGGISIVAGGVLCVSLFTSLITLPFGLWEQGIIAIIATICSMILILYRSTK